MRSWLLGKIPPRHTWRHLAPPWAPLCIFIEDPVRSSTHPRVREHLELLGPPAPVNLDKPGPADLLKGDADGERPDGQLGLTGRRA